MSDPDDEKDADVNDLVRQLNAMARRVPGPAPEEDAAAGNVATGDAREARIERIAPAPRARGGGEDWQLTADEEDGRERLSHFVARAREAGATDVFFVAGTAPTVRVDGQLRPLAPGQLEAADVGRLCAALVPSSRRRELAEHGAVDLSWSHPGLGRLRCNVHRESGRWAAAIRLLPANIPTLAELNLPSELAALADLRHGLVLVTGPAGSGKSTTLAALIGLVNAKRRAHVITVEDPVEYRHPAGLSLIEQIELGRDTPSFGSALRFALRQDPDVLLVGEMRDTETIALAITAAETGHLVFSTLHTGDAAQSVTRIVDSYPPGQSGFIRSQLSAALAAVISQQLVPRADGKGRVPAVEIVLATDAVRNLIQKGQGDQLGVQVALSREKGMRSFDLSLAELVRQGLVDPHEARARARRPREFELLLGG